MKRSMALKTLAIMGMFLLLGCYTMTGETAGEYVDDSVIHAQITKEVIKDAEAQYFKIEVTVTRGEVVLTGFVNSTETEQRLIGKIQKIRGVKTVKSLLKVEKRP